MASSPLPRAGQFTMRTVSVVESCHPQTDQQASTCALRVTTTISLDMESKTALCKLQLPVTLRVPPRNQIRATPIHLFIRPEHVRLLAHSRHALPKRLAPICKKLSGREVVHLRFSLVSHASLIVPDIRELVIANHESVDVFGALQQLATRHELSVYIPGDKITAVEASALCTAASTANLLQSSLRAADEKLAWP